MSVDISVSITDDVVDIIATPTVNIVNVTNSASINPGLYDLSQFTNTSINPFVRTSGLSAYVPTSRTLTINGTTQDLSADRTFTVSTGITIGTTAITSGTVGRVLFEGTGNVVQESANLFWDNTNGRLGIGTSSPSNTLHLNTTTNVYNCRIQSQSSSGAGLIGTEYYWDNTQLATFSVNGPSGEFKWFLRSGYFSTFYSNALERMRIFTTGNIGINTTTDAGFKLDVNGTARVQGNTTISLNQNGVTLINASNTTSGTASTAELRATTGGGFIGLGKYSASTNSYKFIASSDSYLYSATIGDIAIINDFATGRIKFGAGASSTAQATLFSTGNFAINTTTDAGFKLDVNGTARVNASAQNVFQISGTNAVATRIDINHATNTGFQLSLSSVRKWSIASYGAGDFTFYNDALTSDALFIKGNTNNVILGSTTDVASALLNVTSTTKGFLPPRGTNAQMLAIASPATGLIFFDNTNNKLNCYDGTTWQPCW